MSIFTETSDRFLRMVANQMGIKLNKIASKDDFTGKALNGFYIVNLDEESGEGTHWTGLLINPYYAIYFDPFGLAPPQQIRQYVRNWPLIYNTVQIQDIVSKACGYFVLDFFKYFKQYKDKDLNTNLKVGHKMSKFLQPYDVNDRSKNELILSERIKELLN